MAANCELIKRTELFLRESFAQSDTAKDDSAGAAYRVEHSIRVANIGRCIARKEGFDETAMVIACLLHDIAYCRPLVTAEERRDHGRISAGMARPFLQELGLPEHQINDICYAIAIHVDDEADFQWNRTAFSETVSDADNIDRFDVYRIYENLHYVQFESMSLEEKKEHVDSMLLRLEKLLAMPLGTDTAQKMWQEKITYYTEFYQKLREQIDSSNTI